MKVIPFIDVMWISVLMGITFNVNTEEEVDNWKVENE